MGFRIVYFGEVYMGSCSDSAPFLSERHDQHPESLNCLNPKPPALTHVAGPVLSTPNPESDINPKPSALYQPYTLQPKSNLTQTFYNLQVYLCAYISSAFMYI